VLKSGFVGFTIAPYFSLEFDHPLIITFLGVPVKILKKHQG